MKFNHHIPAEPLRTFVKSIFYYSDYSGNSKYEIILPDGEPQLVIALDESIRRVKTDVLGSGNFIELKKSWIKGMFSKPVKFESEQNASVLCIQFEPYGLSRFFGIPTTEYIESFVAANLMIGNTVDVLRDQLLETIDFHEKVILVENYLKNRLKKDSSEKTFIENILKNHKLNRMSLLKLSTSAGYSQKHFISKFKEQVGLTPKSYQRLLNVNNAISLLSNSENTNYSHVAYDCGFYDQSHFIKNFKLTTGITPKAYLNTRQIYPHVLNVD